MGVDWTLPPLPAVVGLRTSTSQFVLITLINAFIFGVIAYHNLHRSYNISLLNIYGDNLWLLLSLLLYLILKIKRIDLAIGYGVPYTGNGAAGFTLK